jgi:starch-binding outer membrane protein, SusD/RagB family
MKKIFYTLCTFLFALSSCDDLDVYPLSEGSSESWYSSITEIEMSLNSLYSSSFWYLDNDQWTDDWMYRESVTPINTASINGEWSEVRNVWSNSYKAIARANILLANLQKARDLGIPEKHIEQYTAEAKFVRAQQYATLINHFGDVVYLEEVIGIEQAFNIGRKDKNTVIPKVYQDFDEAANALPVKYNGLARATKGAALALKARFALYNGDWAVARDAAQACLALDYQLHPSFADLFASTTRNSKESIFILPRSVEFNQAFSAIYYIPRTSGGYGSYAPTWELLSAFLCTDGKPVDESPLFNPRNPFENRDPRCAATIVAFGTRYCYITYQPHVDSLTTYNFKTGQRVKNNDTQANAQYASYTGLLWRKGIDEAILDNPKLQTDKDQIYIRLAEMYLTYAEAKIELGEIDESVLAAINRVRARAYGVAYDAVDQYPAVTTLDQAELRKIIRFERRMEFANEGLRYMDIIRWRLAEKVLNRPLYGLLSPVELREKVVKKGLWFFPSDKIEIDEEGVVNLDPIYQAGLARRISIRSFDKTKQYVWPIPTKEILINDNLIQNPNY